jgi:undecaprenyl-diphosphatase
MHDIFTSIILGIVEGLTEFLPVSSTGHMILVDNLIQPLSTNPQFWSAFEVIIQLGAILAVVVLYKERFYGFCGLNRPKGSPFPSIRTLWEPGKTIGWKHILVAIFPALLLGFLLHHWIKTVGFHPVSVVSALAVGGVLLIAVDYWRPKPRTREVDVISVKQAFWIGIAQCLALWPGFSRSGATIIGGVYAGLSQKVAAEFSFIIAVPVMIAATGYDFLKSYQYFTANRLGLLAIGFVISFFVAILAIKWFLKLLGRFNLAPFGVYRIILSIVYFFMVINHS